MQLLCFGTGSAVRLTALLIFMSACGFSQQRSAHGANAAQAVDSLRADNTRSELFTISSGDSVLPLAHQFIIEGSVSVTLDGRELSPSEYILGARFGTVKLRKGVWKPTPGSPKAGIRIAYRFLPFTFQESYRHRVPLLKTDSVTGKSRQVAKPVSGFTIDDLFGAGLQKSGSIIRGLSVGSNRDLSLNSGFRMQMSGKVAENIEVLAALTDENIPLQPEGTTQNLQEIDKVFVEIRGTNLSATLGDFVLGTEGTEFANFSRKLQGAKGNGVYRNSLTGGALMGAAATTRGKFASNQFQGLDAVQGPYRLSGRGNERNIIVIAGTERVYLNGEQMVRGENNDYTIEYSLGELTFTPKRIISRASRIVVDYEYTDRQFTRNLVAGQTGNTFLNERLSIKATVVREADDKDSPVELSLADSDKAVLANAGGDPALASRNGAEYVGPGKGQYRRIDTAIVMPGSVSPTPYIVYRYGPGDSLNAVYSVVFTFVGSGSGDYLKVTTGQYQFAGVHAGSYAPIRFLPLPEAITLTDFAMNWNAASSLSLAAEGAYSKHDLNQFSPLANARANGGALNASLQYHNDSLSFGAIRLTARERYLQETFNPIDRIDQPEFSRTWNLENVVTGSEELSEGGLSYNPIPALRIDAGAGYLRKADLLSTNRYTGGVGYHDSSRSTLEYSTELLKTSNSSLGSKTDWIRDRAFGEVTAGPVIPGIRYEHEYRLQQGTAIDTGALGSFRFNEIAPRITVPSVLGTRLVGEFGWRLDDSLFQGELKRASKTSTERLEIVPPTTEDLSSQMSVILRTRSFVDEFRSRNADANTALLRLQARYTPLRRGIESDWFYEAAAERSAKFERVFQQVPKGTGNYIYLGDLNGNHAADEQEFQLTRFDGDYVSFVIPSDQLIPITDLKVSSRIRLNGSRLFASGSDLDRILSWLSTESSIRIAEKSSTTETKDVYFLKLGSFLNDQTTLDGLNQFTQDIYLHENAPDFSVRFHFDQRMSFTQYSAQNERGYFREQSVRLRFHLVPEIANQIDAGYKVDNLSTNRFSFRARDVRGSTLAMDFSYRPEQRYELGFRFGVGRLTNADTTTADLNDQGVRFVYSIETKGQIRAELNREEALIGRQGLLVPFELTGGRFPGQTWLWRLNIDYRIAQFVQATIGYDGRTENGNAPLHTGRAEVRAFF